MNIAKTPTYIGKTPAGIEWFAYPGEDIDAIREAFEIVMTPFRSVHRNGHVFVEMRGDDAGAGK